MIKVGIIGGAGYTAGELIRLLINHPDVEIIFVHSESNAGNKITDIHTGLFGETDLIFTSETPFDEIDLLFFCTAHGDTRKFIECHNLPEELRIIDLSTDYRLDAPVLNEWPIPAVLLLPFNWLCCRWQKICC